MKEKTVQELTINGEMQYYSIDEFPTNLSDLLQQLSLQQQSIVAEVDGKIINKKNFTATILKPGMKIELVKFVGGG